MSSDDYSDRHKKNNAYDTLVHKYNERYPEATRDDVCCLTESVRRLAILHNNIAPCREMHIAQYLLRQYILSINIDRLGATLGEKALCI